MRITVNYFEGYPELEDELSRYPLRARAERLRNLASIGLSMLNQSKLASLGTAVFPERSSQSAPEKTEIKPAEGNSGKPEVVGNSQQVVEKPAGQAKPDNPVSSTMIKNLFGQV